MDRTHNKDFLYIDCTTGVISKYWHRQRLGMKVTVDMKTIEAPAVEHFRTLSFKDPENPFRPKTDGVYA